MIWRQGQKAVVKERDWVTYAISPPFGTGKIPNASVYPNRCSWVSLSEKNEALPNASARPVKGAHCQCIRRVFRSRKVKDTAQSVKVGQRVTKAYFDKQRISLPLLPFLLEWHKLKEQNFSD